MVVNTSSVREFVIIMHECSPAQVIVRSITFRSPGKVAVVQAQCTVLLVAAPDSHHVDSLGADLHTSRVLVSISDTQSRLDKKVFRRTKVIMVVTEALC